MRTYTLIEGEVLEVRWKSVLFEVHDREIWVPRSAILTGDTIKAGDKEISISDDFLASSGITNRTGGMA